MKKEEETINDKNGLRKKLFRKKGMKFTHQFIEESTRQNCDHIQHHLHISTMYSCNIHIHNVLLTLSFHNNVLEQ